MVAEIFSKSQDNAKDVSERKIWVHEEELWKVWNNAGENEVCIENKTNDEMWISLKKVKNQNFLEKLGNGNF